MTKNSSIRVFSNESILCSRWSKYWSFSFSISPSNEYSGLISFRMDWLDLLAVQGALKSPRTLSWTLSFYLHFISTCAVLCLVAQFISTSDQIRSVAQSCPTLCDPMNRSTPGLPVHHQLPEFTQTHVHQVCDTIQPSHPLSSPSPPAPNPSQRPESFPMSQVFAWGSQNTGVSALASFLPKKSQGWSPSEWTGWISLQSKGLSSIFSNTTVKKHQFFSAQPSSQSNSHIHTCPMEKP